MNPRSLPGVGALALACVMAPALLVAQTIDDASERAPVEDQVAEVIAEVWGLSVADVHVDIAEDIPARVDSLDAVEGVAGRWIVTFWSDGGAVRRFARAGYMSAVPVAARELARGVTVAQDDVQLENRVVWDAPTLESRDVVGLVTERALAIGDPMRFPAVREPLLVRGGEQVEGTLLHSGVVMTVRGEALGSAREGDLVLVRLASGVRMEGRAVGPGQVALIAGGS